MEREITATSNELVKTLIKLKQKKYRDLLNKVLIEGERFVTEMAERGADFEYILYSADFEGVESINANCPKIKCSTAVMEVLSQTVTPAGVIAVVRVGLFALLVFVVVGLRVFSSGCARRPIADMPDRHIAQPELIEHVGREHIVDKADVFIGIENAVVVYNDTCRFWDAKTNEKLDKDRFRRDMGGVEDAYAEIFKRVTKGE